MNVNSTKHNLLCHNNKILQVIELSPTIFRIRFKNTKISHISNPGQFINIKITDTYEPFLRRPFSINRINKREGWIEILFRVIGKGTQLLSQKKVGEMLNFIGPLGYGFKLTNNRIKTGLVIGGGLGIAPLLFLCNSLIEKNISPHLFYGVKTASEFCCLEDFEELKVKINLATEDGSLGYNGFVTDLVENKINKFFKNRQLALFACGPNSMLNRVNLIAQKNSFSCQLSLETLMACGVGACLGCGIRANKAGIDYLYVCKDGPVFDGSKIDLSD